MSQWTHVNASIRIDALRTLDDNPKIDFGLSWGSESNEEIDKYDKFKGLKVPSGSEGCLDTTLWTHPNESCATAYTANIFGDLRDYIDENEIVRYFNKFCTGKSIRSGIVEIEIPNYRTVIYRYEHGKKKFIKVYEKTWEDEKW